MIANRSNTALNCSGKMSRDRAGFTLIEVVLVIIIIGILATAAVGTGQRLFTSARTAETRKEMDRLATAIVGNSELRNSGMRTDFGYVGDIGSLPPDLDALHTNPGGFPTWHGPYMSSSFTGAPNDYQTDSWGSPYQYSGGLTISSVGGSAPLNRQLAESIDHLLRNRVSGAIVDADGSPPGSPYNDSLTVQLTFPNGAGGYLAKSAPVSTGGFFQIDSVPIGNHTLEIVYEPAADSLLQFVGVTPGGEMYGEHRLSFDYWSAGAGPGLIYVPLSDTLFTGGTCNSVIFWIQNNSTSAIIIDYLILDWSTPTAWFKEILWNSTKVVDGPTPNIAAGDTSTFSSSQTIAAGEQVKLTFKMFNETSGPGGFPQDMSNVDFSAEFSDGSLMTAPVGDCP